MAASFEPLSRIIQRHAGSFPERAAIVCGDTATGYAELDRLATRISASLQRDGAMPGDVVAICAGTSMAYAAAFLGAVRVGAVVAPLAPSSIAQPLRSMLDDSKPVRVFCDRGTSGLLQSAGAGDALISLDPAPGVRSLDTWLAPPGRDPAPVDIEAAWPFNIIYSSGTTGAPKGIVQSHERRWQQVSQLVAHGYGPDTVALLATPLYSNTTLFPTLAAGGTVVLMPKFDPRGYLALAQQHRATHTMLVPVQFQRIMAVPDFGRFDLSSFRIKFCTGAPFSPALKRDVLKRWPGGLVEFWGTTEGGGSCALVAHQHPDKLHTVGRPAAGCEIRLIDDDGIEVPRGQAGEIVARSATMMAGYHNRTAETREAEWFDAEGRRYLRSGDIGRFDDDGFLELVDRKKDMVISGGFNIYPSDLEAVLREHPAVDDVAVVGVPSERWGETPVAFVVIRAGDAPDATALLAWANARVGKTQRLAALHTVPELPRNALGKVLKRELRNRHEEG